MLSIHLFTLSWTHSVEKTEWLETWLVSPAGLEIVEARVKGSGAGMEPPEGAALENGWWVYRPTLGVQQEIVLAASGATGGGWKLCHESGCLTIGAEPSLPIRVTICAGNE